jgi:hypothetical protein
VLSELGRELESNGRLQQAAASERAQQAVEQPARIYTHTLSLFLSLVSDEFGANELGCELCNAGSCWTPRGTR